MGRIPEVGAELEGIASHGVFFLAAAAEVSRIRLEVKLACRLGCRSGAGR